ncbi:MAG: homing endonuclease [Parcubacteria group bacterium Licking1014_17]|nr:MAG: homing endonuclease [Parcubacteria group bacterium Licking1014_17]
MTEYQKSIIIGTLLGDSYIHYSKAGTTSLSIKQANRYKEYVFWLYQNLYDLFHTEPKQRTDNQQWYARSFYSKELNELHGLFYKNRVKKVPENIDKLLISPVSLAVWFMDDGTLDYRKNDHCAFHLCTNCFTLREAKRLASALDSNFKISTSVHYTLCRGKRQPRIYIGARGRSRFTQLISPHVLDCFRYKLPRFRYPSETCRLNTTDGGRLASITR